MNCPPVAGLDAYLRRRMPADDTARFREHLDACPSCWDRWNHFRWDQAADSLLLNDLQVFLRDDFEPYFDSSVALAHSWTEAAPQTQDEIADFFRTSIAYLYNLSIWEASGNRPPYASDAIRVLGDRGARVVLDYGCGIGSDTLTLLDSGFAVIACDYHSPSTEFLRWRAARRGLAIDIYEPDQLGPGPAPDTLWIIDTIDQLADLATLTPILRQVDLLVCEELRHDRGHGSQGFHHRRNPHEVGSFFAAHGLTELRKPANGVSLSYWTRPPAERNA
jgi:SAM-dependent methyltransferase